MIFLALESLSLHDVYFNEHSPFHLRHTGAQLSSFDSHALIPSLQVLDGWRKVRRLLVLLSPSWAPHLTCVAVFITESFPVAKEQVGGSGHSSKVMI